ncbi:MAG: NADH-quinone oxidoreductase subunit G [Alphaproteobacteria bacterium]|nr:NADH-quinone oxidoreductase subunit G [Alphaproteobacteria bacterium]|tara:strand:- start:389 stop:2440 length:2052 start_codon:yes stop_codon:yes gene_type:complete
MPKLTINGVEIEVEPGTSILQAAEEIGVEIPRFCYHDRLTVPANCRMCLVDLEGAPKPVASCAMACGDGMVVHTESPRAKKARQGVMEFLLINHPLDCPICDQGGECDLQDQAVAYGYDRSRYHETKRSVKDKELGPLVETVMTRCINCTRCVRFAEEIAGVDDIGQLHRGEDAEITTFIEKSIDSELSGNLVDVCPVGALTNKPYAYKARPWELKKTQSIDVHDAVGSNIRIDARGREVMRVMPRLNEAVNEEWIADKTRYALDGLAAGRLDRPYIRNGRTKKLEEASWSEALALAAKKIKAADAKSIAALVGDLADVEAVTALKDLMAKLGVPNMDCRVDGALYPTDNRAAYLFNTTIEGLEQADSIVLIGTNPRTEAAMINARIRKTWLAKRVKVAVLGEACDLNYPYTHLADNADGFAAADKFLKGSKSPVIIVGNAVYKRSDLSAVMAEVEKLCDKHKVVRKDWNGFNALHTAAGRVGALEIGFVPQKGGMDIAKIVKASADDKLDVIYLMGVDDADVISGLGKKTFKIYQGHHGDLGASHADIIFPAAAYSEKDASYMNTEGRLQRAHKAVSAPGEAKEDWAIIRALSDALDCALPYNDLYELRKSIRDNYAAMPQLDEITAAEWSGLGGKGKLTKAKFTADVDNFYMTNVICRASAVMRACSDAFVSGESNKLAAE